MIAIGLSNVGAMLELVVEKCLPSASSLVDGEVLAFEPSAVDVEARDRIVDGLDTAVMRAGSMGFIDACVCSFGLEGADTRGSLSGS